MLEMMKKSSYKDFKVVMDAEIKEAAAGFVRIGYLLKVARDTDVLKESGYTSVAEFAKAEYGLTKDMVSRYIAINDKYSEDGYSDVLQERFKDFGVAKLAEMLTLPEIITDDFTADITKREIQEIKRDIKEEQERTDIEVMMEEQQEVEFENTLEKGLFEHFREQENFKRFYDEYVPEIEKTEGMIEKVEAVFADKDRMLDAIAPAGVANIRVRVPAVGKVMITVNGVDDPLTVVNLRSMEKEIFGWKFVSIFLKKMYLVGTESWETAYRAFYGEIEEKVEVAPVQQVVETAEIQNTEPILEEKEEAEKAAVDEAEIVVGEVVENTEDNAEMEQDIDVEDTATSEEEKENAKKLHVLKQLEKYYTYLNEDDLRVLEAMLEDGKRRKREYGSFDVGSTL